MNAERIDYYVNQLRGVLITNIGRKLREILLDATSEEAAAEREACAKMCEERVTYPAGHGGQWEGYGPVKCTRSGQECADTIRARCEK